MIDIVYIVPPFLTVVSILDALWPVLIRKISSPGLM